MEAFLPLTHGRKASIVERGDRERGQLAAFLISALIAASLASFSSVRA